jgi:WASH complex subunit 7
VKRAERFNHGIRKLGLLQDDSTYLDKFRVLITQMGNALGYVRMVRRAGVEASADAVQLLPDLEDVVGLEALAREAAHSDATIKAARVVDTLIGDLVTSFLQSDNYIHVRDS